MTIDLALYVIASSELDGVDITCTRCSYRWNPMQLDGSTLADLLALADQHEATAHAPTLLIAPSCPRGTL